MSHFQKRHYEFLARWLSEAALPITDYERFRLTLSLCTRLAADNPRFDRERFLRAAGVVADVISLRHAAE